VKKKRQIMPKYNYLTQEGYDKLTAELEEMKSSGRPEIAKAIAEARDKGDLSENAEYSAAKDAQGLLEMKINELETILASSRIVDESQLDTSEVRLLANVTMKNLKNGKELTYKLVSESEADLKARKISIDSPMGKGLLGKKVGEVAVVETPGGRLEFKVLNIAI